MTSHPHIVVIGGGTGSFTVLSGLKHHTQHITAIVNMVDDGGSTGILRDELGVLPPGDVRQCLVALSDDDHALRQLFNYRFAGQSLGGHSFGNLFLTALEKTTGNFAEAVKTASQVLNIAGTVLPVTLDNCRLIFTRPNGDQVVGQYAVETAALNQPAAPQLSLHPQPRLNPEVSAAIAGADLVVIAPGNLYASLVPTLLVEGVGEAIRRTAAPIAYVVNLVTKPGHTDGFQVHDFAAEIERYIGRGELDYVIYNQQQPGPELLQKYADAGEHWVDFDPAAFAPTYQTLGVNLINDTIAPVSPNDTLIRRTLIRHDSAKLAQTLLQLPLKKSSENFFTKT